MAGLVGWPCPRIQAEKFPETLQLVRFARLRKGTDLEVYLYLESLRSILGLNIDLSHVPASRSKAVEGRRNEFQKAYQGTSVGAEDP